MSRVIIHDKNDFFKDDYNSYYQIEKGPGGFYKLEKYQDLKYPNWRGDTRAYTIIELDDLRISKPRTYSLLCLLVELRKMQCGTCDTPFIEDRTIKDLTGVIYNYNLLTDEGRAKLEINIRRHKW